MQILNLYFLWGLQVEEWKKNYENQGGIQQRNRGEGERERKRKNDHMEKKDKTTQFLHLWRYSCLRC
jgi:hypothetical protein